MLQLNTPSVSVCNSQNKFFDAATSECVEFTVCPQDQDLDTQTNSCTDKAASIEVCTIRLQVYDDISDECVDCEEDEEFDASTNTCTDKQPSLDVCTFRNKYFNAADGSCDVWLSCDAETHDLDTSTNTCQQK